MIWVSYSGIMLIHYGDAIMIVSASEITTVSMIYSAVCLGTDQRKHQSSASLAFVRGIHRWPVNSPHKGPVMRKCFHLMTSSWNIPNDSILPSVRRTSGYHRHFWNIINDYLFTILYHTRYEMLCNCYGVLHGVTNETLVPHIMLFAW